MHRVKAQLICGSQDLFESMGDDGSGFLSDLVFGRKIKIIGTKAKTSERILIPGQYTGSNVNEIVQVDAAHSEPPEILFYRDGLAP